MTDTPNNTLRNRLEDGQQNIQEMLRMIQEHPHMQVMREEAIRITQEIRNAVGDTAHGVLEKMPTRLREKIKELPPALQKMIRVGSYGVTVSLAACSKKNTAESAMKQTQERLQTYHVNSESGESMLDWVNGGKNWIEQGITSTGEKVDSIFVFDGEHLLYAFVLAAMGYVIGEIKEGDGILDKTSMDELFKSVIVGLPISLLVDIKFETLTSMLIGAGFGALAAGIIKVIKQQIGNCS